MNIFMTLALNLFNKYKLESLRQYEKKIIYFFILIKMIAMSPN